jgi:glutathione S-transferase
MSLTLYLHPLASFCHKVLIALYENDVPFRPVTVDLGDPGSAAALLQRWPASKIPVLHDGAAGRVVPESSIILEYLDTHYRGPRPLLPEDPDARLDVRLWDRFFDHYVGEPMQKIVTDRLRPDGAADPHGVLEARAMLDQAYPMIEARMRDREWAAGDGFSLADCAALPALFFASIVHPFHRGEGAAAAYLERLIARPAARRVLREAQPWFGRFPYRHAMPERYLAPF